MHASDDTVGTRQIPPIYDRGSAAATILAWMAFLIPAVGVPCELMLQDTLKSAVLAFGTFIAAWVFFWQRRHDAAPLQWHGLLVLPLAFMGYALGSAAWSHTYLASVEAIRWFVLSVLLFVGVQAFSRSNWIKLLWGIHAGVVVASVWAALQFWWGWSAFPQAAFPASTFANRNFFAEYAVAVFPLSVYWLLSMKASRPLAWLALSVAFNLVVILMTGTRSALIALCVVLPIMVMVVLKTRGQLAFPNWSRSQQMVVCLIFMLGAAILGSLPTDNPQILQEGRGETALQRSFQRTASMAESAEYSQGSFSVRSAMWLATARMMVANPLIGVGAGAWEVQIPLYQRTDTTLETDYYAHNELLQLLSEYGLVVGGLSFAFLLAYLIKAAATTRRASTAASPEAPLRAFTLTSLLALLIVSNAGFPLHLAGGGMLLTLCLGLLASSDARLGSLAALTSRPLHISARGRRLILVGLSCCLVITTWISLQALRAESKLVSAITLANRYAQEARLESPGADRIKDQALQLAREGIAINPHYRKLTGEIAEPFAARGDWQDALWILESLTASRPHVVALWTGIATGAAALGEHDRAQQAWVQVQRLKPAALTTTTLQATLLLQAGQGREAAALLERQFDKRDFDWDMVQAGYAIGYKTQNWTLAIRSLELRNSTWPEQAADGFFRLGKLYAEPQVNESSKALAAFRAGLAAVPKEQESNYRAQVPSPFNAQM